MHLIVLLLSTIWISVVLCTMLLIKEDTKRLMQASIIWHYSNKIYGVVYNINAKGMKD